MSQVFSLETLAQTVADSTYEGELFDEIQRIRERFSPQLKDTFGFLRNRETALEWSHTGLGRILERVLRFRSVDTADPGHGSGHWARDYMHALMLANDPDLDPAMIPCCFFGGTLHDIGTLFLDRYADKDRVFRHAEAGALIVRAAALESGALTEDQADLIAYIIAAHTHYLKSSPVLCKDGVTRTVDPYVCETDTGAPLLEVWLPRWVDRLDCNGPCFVGRHYLTLARDHEDYSSQQGFYKVSLADHMRPLLRSKEEIAAAGGKMTMLEHLRMFASSQNNQSPYGKHDSGPMVVIRNRYRVMLERIIQQVANPECVDDEEYWLQAWTRFLAVNVEPSSLGEKTAKELEWNFARLSAQTRTAWISGFSAVMHEYESWSEHALKFMRLQPSRFVRLPGVFEDVCEIFKPTSY